MTSALADTSSSTQTSAPPRRDSRGWIALLSGFATVLVLGFALFALHSQQRTQELIDHYDRAAARSASQVGARWSGVAKRLDAHGQEADLKQAAAASKGGEDPVQIRDCKLLKRGQLAVSEDGDGIAWLIQNRRCGYVSFSTLLNGPRTVFAGNRSVARRFDQLYLLDGDGKVLAEQRPTPQRRTTKVPGATLSPSEGKPRYVMIGAEQYRAFVRPVQTEAETREPPRELFVCGLVAEQALLQDGRRIESPHVLLGLFLLAMAIVGMPAAKLWLIGPHARYRRLDVRTFGVATVLGLCLCLLLVLGGAARASLRSYVDEQLRAAATPVHDALAQRIERAAIKLEKASHESGFALPKQPGRCSRTKKSGDSKDDNDWNVIVAIDGDGQQFAKHFREQSTPCIKVSDREYFKAVRSENMHELSQQPIVGSVQIVRSHTTGKLGLVVAMPAAANKEITVALEVPLKDFNRVLLPKSFQLAVVDARGRIMLHSDNDTFQGVNFFDDVGKERLVGLRSAHEAKLQDHRDFDYLGVPSRAFLMPLQAGWSVIAIAPDELFEVPTRQMVLLTLLCGLATLALLAACVLFCQGARPLLSWLDGRYVRQKGERRAGDDEHSSGEHDEAQAVGESEKTIVASPLTMSDFASGTPGAPMQRSVRLAQGMASWIARLPIVCISSLLLSAGFVWTAYDHVAEEFVRRQLHHGADQRARHPACFSDAGNCLAANSIAPLEKAAYIVPTPDEVVKASVLGQLFALTLDKLAPIARSDLEASSLPPLAELQHSKLPWKTERAGDALVLSWKPPKPPFSARVPPLASQVPSLWRGFGGARVDGWLLATSAFVFLVFAASTMYASFRRLTFADAIAQPGKNLDAKYILSLANKRPVLVLYPPLGFADELSKVGLRCLDGADFLKDLRKVKINRPVFVEHAERYFCKPRRLLALLGRHRRGFVLLADVDWTRWLPPERRTRLDLAFRRFHVEVGTGLSEWPGSSPGRRALASDIWTSCNPDERRLLTQLAIDGYAAPHPDNFSMVSHLRSRGILKRDRLEIAEPRFAKFVRHTVSAAELRKVASNDENDLWNRVRRPISIFVGLLLAVVSYMQPELAALGLPASSILAGARVLFERWGMPGLGE